MSKSNSFFELASRVSNKGQHDQYFVGAVLYKGSRVISVGFNKHKSHTIMGHVKHLHAELDALSHVKFKDILRGANIFVVRRTKSGKVGMARPCKSCWPVLFQYGIRMVFFTDKDGNIRSERLL